jgi:hypothetical protein
MEKKDDHKPDGWKAGSWCSDGVVLLKWGLLAALTCPVRIVSGNIVIEIDQFRS